ncbi:MAG: hypothetical protein VKL39_05555, partial [Leptolyngbyaceae bacterium]|nr:hypothetical protein [Leptolyngbyaceae bacterium]
MNITLLLAWSSSLSDGLEAIAAVSVASFVFCPLFCWVLTHPNALTQFGTTQSRAPQQDLWREFCQVAS